MQRYFILVLKESNQGVSYDRFFPFSLLSRHILYSLSQRNLPIIIHRKLMNDMLAFLLVIKIEKHFITVQYKTKVPRKNPRGVIMPYSKNSPCNMQKCLKRA